MVVTQAEVSAEVIQVVDSVVVTVAAIAVVSVAVTVVVSTKVVSTKVEAPEETEDLNIKKFPVIDLLFT